MFSCKVKKPYCFLITKARNFENLSKHVFFFPLAYLTLIKTSHKRPKKPSTENLGVRVGRDNICIALGHCFQQVHTGFALKRYVLQDYSSRKLSQVGCCDAQRVRCKPKLHRLCACPLKISSCHGASARKVKANLPLTAITVCVTTSPYDMLHRPPTCHIQDTRLETLLLLQGKGARSTWARTLQPLHPMAVARCIQSHVSLLGSIQSSHRH